MSRQSLDPVFLNVPAALREETERLWLRYVAAAGEQGIAVPAAAEVIESLPRVWAASDFVAQHCVRTPALLAELAGGDLQAVYPEPEYARRLELDLTKAVDEPALALCLRRFRRREMVRIAWRDLAGWADLRKPWAICRRWPAPASKAPCAVWMTGSPPNWARRRRRPANGRV